MTLLLHAPALSPDDAARICREHYHLIGLAHQLPSERDQNYQLTTQSGENFVLKIANSREQRALLEAQNEAMNHLASHVSFCPRVIPSRSGEHIQQIQSQTATHYVRLVTWLPGHPLATVTQGPTLWFDLGRKLGRLNRGLSDFDHPAFHRNFHWDLAKGPKIIDEYASLVTSKDLRLLLAEGLTVFESAMAARLSKLSCQIIHGDANDYNVLIEADRVVGLIDFGDMIHSYSIGELAIALAYVVLDKAEPLGCAKSVVAGYVSEAKLDEDESAALWPLMLMRLCMSVCLAAFQQNQKPDNEYLEISQQSIRDSLPALLKIDYRLATDDFQTINSP